MGLTIVRSIQDCRAVVKEMRARGKQVGFVPTMGALHEGHESLMRRAREQCGVVVVSVFVNPTQFNSEADFTGYPRDEPWDTQMARRSNVDVLFMPSEREMYPGLQVAGVGLRVGGPVAERLEGKFRGTAHFDGVATVVNKLFNIVQPDVAYFGRKDAQQCAVVRQLVRDLNLPVAIETLPVVRDKDGLALSSRNVRLNRVARLRAVSLAAALRAVGDAVGLGEAEVSELLSRGRRKLDVDELEYFEIVDGETFAPVERVERAAIAVTAGWVGGVRLIDAMELIPIERPRSHRRKSGTPSRRPGAVAVTGIRRGP